MKSVAYLIEDTSLGGVTKTMAGQVARLEHQFRFAQHAVNAGQPLPPQLDADAVVVHFTVAWSRLPFLTLLRAQRSRRPLVMVEHMYTEGFERACVPSVARFRLMLRLAYRLADVVVAVSEGQGAWMLAAGLLPPEKLRVIPSASDCSGLLGIPPPSFDANRPLQLGAYGRYSHQKGFDVLIEAMRMLPPEVATLRIRGYGDDELALRTAAAGMSNVEVGGTVRDLAAFLGSCDAIVVPSRWEAFGLVATEARSAARPIIVSALDGLTEQVGRDTGIAVPPEEPTLLAEAIRQLRARDVTAMGLSAREAARSHFERHIKGWANLLDSLDDGETAPARSLSAAT